MRKRGFTFNILTAVLAAAVLLGSYTTYHMTNGNQEPKQTETSEQKNIDKNLLASKKVQGVKDVANTIDIKKPSENELDTSSIDISGDIADCIKNLDGKNFDKNTKNYKRLLVKFGVPKAYRSELEKMMKAGKKVPDILIIYDFLSDNYGTMSDLKELVDKLGSGTGLNDVMSQYNSTHPEYVPSKFDDSYITNLMKTMSIDDIMIADRISKKGLAKFDDLISKRKAGIPWKDINTSLGIINTSGKLPRMSISKDQVNKCMKENGMNEKDATDVLIMTWKTGKDYATVSSELKSGKKKNDIYAESYNQKYR